MDSNTNWTSALTHRNCPGGADLDAGSGSGVGAAVVDGIADADVAVQRDGTQVHDGGCGQQDVQKDPDWTES